MLALYRAGRQSDALAVYRETSELLREQLGLEPSHALRELERSMFNQDATLEPAPPWSRYRRPGFPFPRRRSSGVSASSARSARY